MAKELISTFYFEQQAGRSEKLYLEKRPKGKWLCYETEKTIKMLKLTKKSFKSLKRLAFGPTIQEYVEMNDSIYEQYDDGMDDVWYTQWDRDYKKERIGCLPAIIPPNVKEKSLFITQRFVFKVK